MKQIPIDECPAGHWLDVAISEAQGKVKCDQWTPVHFPVCGHIKNCQHDNCYVASYPMKYSTDIAAAWELAEELYQQTEEWMSITRDTEGNYWAGVIGAVSDYDWWEYSSKADTASLAITRAYLKARSVEWVEVPGKMCQEYGSPQINSPRVISAAKKISAVYKFHSAGGGLHIVLEDRNLEDSFLEFCKNYVNNREPSDEVQGQRAAELECIETLLSFTIDERAAALAVYNGIS